MRTSRTVRLKTGSERPHTCHGGSSGGFPEATYLLRHTRTRPSKATDGGTRVPTTPSWGESRATGTRLGPHGERCKHSRRRIPLCRPWLGEVLDTRICPLPERNALNSQLPGRRDSRSGRHLDPLSSHM